jgi:hypothetical protein
MSDYYALTLPVSSRIDTPSPTLVLNSSSAHQRSSVERIAYHFKREMNYSFVQFESTEYPDYGITPYEAYLFHEIAYDLMKEDAPTKYRFFGACCFRWREWSDAEASWSLDWIWFHPYFRRRNHLKKAWPEFERKYGHFHVAPPLSGGMEAFLRKIGWDNA